MPKLTSKEAIFVDLFYGVVVGSAVALLSLEDLPKLLRQIAWTVAVLEDWYLYYRHVRDERQQAVSYTFKSLLFEFSILLAWFLGFQALREKDKESWFFMFFSFFYIVKVIAGTSFYLKHGQLRSLRMLYDLLWLFLPVSALALGVLARSWAFSAQFWALACATAVVLAAWWILTSLHPPGRP